MPWIRTTPSSFSRRRTGCSSRQAVHQDAKTLTSETCPRQVLARETERAPLGGRQPEPRHWLTDQGRGQHLRIAPEAQAQHGTQRREREGRQQEEQPSG